MPQKQTWVQYSSVTQRKHPHQDSLNQPYNDQMNEAIPCPLTWLLAETGDSWWLSPSQVGKPYKPKA